MRVLVALLFMITIQIVYAQFDIDEDYEIPDCPNESLVYYKDCRGSLDQCSTCLGNAERACRKALKDQNKDDGNCSYCTTHVAGNCDNIKPMCFGNQECNDPNYKCIDYTCVYQSPSK